MEQISYILKKSRRAKNIQLTIKADQSIILTVPHRVSNEYAKQFLYRKRFWIQRKLAEFANQPNYKSIKHTPREIKTLKKQALKIVHERLEYFNHFYQLNFGKISIRNQSTRWGSCSKKGNLNFHYKIAVLPQELVDYIIVHELCHIKEFNHSPAFWNLVKSTIPNYKELKAQLR